MKRAVVVCAVIMLASCTGKVDYAPPVSQDAENSKTISKPKDAVWAELIPALSKNFFVVNTIDKSSGLINISYSGDPEKYIDCGRVHSYVTNLRGERNYDFNGAAAHADYEVMNNGVLLQIDRTVDLDGRMNIVVEEQGPKQSLITVNTRYILTLHATARDVNGRVGILNPETITFNTGGSGRGQKITCVPNGEFERSVLALVN